MSLTLAVQSKRPVRWLASKFTSYPSHRDEIGEWLTERGLLGTIAEVGCNEGAFARQVLKTWAGRHYLMIDPWEAQPREVFKELQGYQYEPSHEMCLKMAKADRRITILRKFSIDAVKDVKDESLDFCYLDGNHAFPHVYADLCAWWPKIKPGGLLGGHDYYNYTKGGHWCEVKKALDRWTDEMWLKFHVSPCTSWWIMKGTL